MREDQVTPREGVGRRDRDKECLLHEARMDDMDMELHKQSGWLKTAAGVLGVAGVILSFVANVIVTKLTTIETLLSDSKVTLMKHDMAIQGLDQRVKDIEARHTYLDQNGFINRKGMK